MKLGTYLKDKREKAGITLKEMQEKSGLRKDIIHIIEAGDLNALPEPRHAQFLIQQYADAVGLDHDKLKERFASDFPDDGDLNEKRRSHPDDEEYKYFKRTIIGFLGIILGLFIIWMILLQVGSEADVFEEKPIYDFDEKTAASKEPEENSEEEKDTADESSTEEATEEDEGESDDSQSTSDYTFNSSDDATFYYDIKVSSPLVIGLSGESPSWVTLTDDAGNNYAYETLSEGEFEISEEANVLYLTLGDATNFNVEIDGERLQNPKQGDAVTIYYEFNLIKE